MPQTTSKTGRAFKLFGLATRLGTAELSKNLRNSLMGSQAQLNTDQTRIAQAKEIVEQLSQLKGAAMKAGQLLSIDAGDYFPPEAMTILSQLQANAQPMPFRDVLSVLNSDLGADRVRDFVDLEQVPRASASIGQVHRAQLNGRTVAIKVQYPGVAESIDSDLAILRRVASSFLKMTGRQIEIDSVFQEFRRVLEQEADYTAEVQLLAEYRERIGDHPDYQVPEAFPSHSGRRVLTLEWKDGNHVDTWLKSRPSLDRRERMSERMLRLFLKEFFEWGLVQTDPNFANFLIAPDDRLVLLDFGATLRYQRSFIDEYTKFLRVIQGGSDQKIVEAAIEFGLIDRREPELAKSLFVELMKVSSEPFQKERQPFQFEDADYAKRTREAGTRFANSLKYSPPPHQILFLHRKLGGLFNFVRKMDVRLDLSGFMPWSINSR